MIQKKSLKDAIQNPEIISVVGELLPGYPNTINYSNFDGKDLFYIKISNVGDSVILCLDTGDAGKICFFSTTVTGSPSSIQLNRIAGDLLYLIPARKNADTSLYFICKGGTSVVRNFKIYIYGQSKGNIDYTVLDNVDGLESMS